MYEDTWYSFVPPEPKAQKEDGLLAKSGHRRRESLLKQPNEGDHGIPGQTNPLVSLFEEPPAAKGPPKATVARRAKSYSDFYHVVRALLTKDCKRARQEYREAGTGLKTAKSSLKFENHYEAMEDDLLDASQEEFQLYRDQLALTERHIDGLLENTTSALNLLANLSESFKSVEAQTTAFQGQCEDLLEEQKRLKTLSDEVGTHLKYYSYLEPITRRLNAPGASSMIGDDGFVEILSNLDSCILFMISHPQHRESDIYLTRYKSLHERTLNLFRIKFTKLVQGDKDKSKRNASSSEKLTITDLFLHLAPDSKGDLALLDGTMEYVLLLSQLEGGKSSISKRAEQTVQALYEIIDNKFLDRLMDLDDPSQAAFREAYQAHLEKYADTIGDSIKIYVDARRELTPSLLERLLRDLEKSHPSGGQYSRSYAHEIVGAILEITSFEAKKFMTIFAGKKEDRSNRPGLVQITVEKSLPFAVYLKNLCDLSITPLFDKLQICDVTEAVDLATWINRHHGANDEVEDDSDEDEKAEISDLDNWKQEVVFELTTTLVSRIFMRLKATAVKEIDNYVPTQEDLGPHSTTKSPSTETNTAGVSSLTVEDSPRARAEKLLGAGILNAYPPLISAVQLFVIFNDLYDKRKKDSRSDELAYTIIHGTCEAINKAAKQIVTRHSSIDSLIFSIKNLVLIKNVVLALEISGSHRASILDFSSIWMTFYDLRSRGGLLDITSYYNMLTQGTLLPRVVESVQDARTELDGLLRQTITKFREECAGKLWNKARKSPEKDHWVVKEQLLAKLKVMFPEEAQLRESLWQAVEELVEDWKVGA